MGLVIILLFSTVVFVGGVIVEQGAEPGSSETILGINPESPRLVVAAVVVSLFLAAAIFLRSGPLILGAAGAFGLIFAFVDALEILHQFQERRPSIAAIAAIAALAHITVTSLAVVLIPRASRAVRGQQGAR